MSKPELALQKRARKIKDFLDDLFPAVEIPLVHSDPFTLLVAVLLSAQTTDKKVNEVTPDLFAIAPDCHAMARLSPEDILRVIRPLGLAPSKARHLAAMSRLLVERFSGEVPRSLEELESLPGVGHKTASVVLIQAFGEPAFPVDTHIHRLATRWGLTPGRNVKQTELDLKKLFAPSDWGKLHLQIIYYGRRYCQAVRHPISRVSDLSLVARCWLIAHPINCDSHLLRAAILSYDTSGVRNRAVRESRLETL